MNITLIILYGFVYAGFHAWCEKTERGQRLRTFLQTWKTDSLLYLILCAGSVFIWSCCAILALGLTLKKLGI